MNQSKWIVVKHSEKPYQLELIKGLLLEHEIESVVMNKKDSSYLNFGTAELLVQEHMAEKAKEIIQKHS